MHKQRLRFSGYFDYEDCIHIEKKRSVERARLTRGKIGEKNMNI
jgi:hypothetical protein